MNLTCTFGRKESSTGLIETPPDSSYIDHQMRSIFAAVFMLASAPPVGSVQTDDHSFSLVFLRDLDIEVAGLLDAYLEAVPECPARADTPIRLWVLDVAWLRVSGALDTALRLDSTGFAPDFPLQEWEAYLQAAGDCLAVFGTISETYHSDSVPGMMRCIELETDLLRADSLWRVAEFSMFERLAEEGYHE
jgi:hypothetical protein